MPLFVIAALLVFWIALSYRAMQRGDLLMAGVYLLAGVALSVYRYKSLRKGEK